MGKLQTAPIYDPVIEDNEGKARLSWTLFFQQLVQGDIGAQWTPAPVGLANVGGAPTITASYYQNQGWTDFWIKIFPVTSTTATAGTTYFDLPFAVDVDAPCFAIAAPGNAANGSIQATTKRCYVPSWSAITSPVTITGRVLSL